MKILVTGANGFIGKNLCLHLNELKHEVIKYDLDTKVELSDCVSKCDFVIHLAGVNRPLSNDEFYDGNTNFTLKLINILKESNRKIPLLFSSSIQAELDNDYGKSKKMAEDLVFDYQNTTGADVYVFRLANAFGKWCKPNYNSVVATFCNNVANGIDISVNDPTTLIKFVYIDDIVATFIKCLDKDGSDNIINIEPLYVRSVGELAKTIKSFKKSRETLVINDLSDKFVSKLYSTYLSYIPEDEFVYELKTNVDDRGSFTEFLKSDDNGQVSINISHPGIVKGNHWHHSKNEKFLVVSGSGVIRFRKIGCDKVIEYFVDGNNLKVVDIPCGYTHNIENIGEVDMVTVMWANENFNVDKPDTYFEEV